MALLACGARPPPVAPARCPSLMYRGADYAVPILLVTGFLGVGKTTVVNHLLAHAEGRRISAVVNDFGAIKLDCGS